MSDKESEESWINPKQDRGWSQESYRAYMKRRDAEEEAIKKGTYEYEYGKPSDKQIGGSHYKDCVIQVGTDASGLELRCLAHLMNDTTFTDILLTIFLF